MNDQTKTSRNASESERLCALARYDILDTGDETEFDDITRLAALVCGTPIALVSLVDQDRQWFKSRYGLDAAETGRNISFCSHAIAGDDLFEIGDASLDARFSNNPLVTGEPKIRFYAGAPLVTADGFRLGTLCVIDRKLRTLNGEQREALRALSRQVMRQLESRRAAALLEMKANFQEAVLNSTEVAIISSDNDGHITGFNRGAEGMFGYRADQLVDVQHASILYDAPNLATRLEEFDVPNASPETPAPTDFARLMTMLAQRPGYDSAEWKMQRADGSAFAARLSITPIQSASGTVIGTLHVARDISKRVAAEAAEARAAAFIGKIASRVPGVIYQFHQHLDGSSTFPYASEHLYAVYQVTPEEAFVDATRVLKKVHPDDVAGLRAAIDLSAQTLTIWHSEYRVVFDDGSIHWVDGNAMPERLSDGSTLWHGVVTEVSERKAAELALVRSQQFLKTLIDALPVGVFTKSLQGDDAGTYLLWNPALAQITGFPSTHVVGNRASAIFPPEIARIAEAHDSEVCRTLAPAELAQYQIRRPDGTVKTLRTRSVPICDERGQIEYVLGMTEDITISLRQQTALRRQQAEMQATSDASPLGLFHTDSRGYVVYVNRMFETIAGCGFSRAGGQGWLSVVHPADRRQLTAEWERAVVSKTGARAEFRFVHADGREVWVHIVAVPVIVEGILTGMVGTVDDITTRRSVQLALISSEKNLRLITDNLPAMVGYIDAGERFRFCSAGYRHVLGFDPALMLGKSLVEVYGEQSYQRIAPPIKGALAGQRMSFERYSERAGEPLYLQCDYIPDIDDDGTVLGFYAMIIDITSRRLAENRLAESERAMRMITENIPALVAHIDAEQRYLFVNAQIGMLFKKDTALMIGRRMEDEHTAEFFALLKPHVTKVLGGERVTFQGEIVIDAKRHFFESTYVPDIDDSGTVSGFYAMTFDTTASRESELRQAASEARLRTITDNIPVLISYIDQDIRIRFINATVKNWLGRTPDEARNRLFSEIISPETYKDRLPYLQRALKGERVEFESVAEAQGIRRFLQTVYLPDRTIDGQILGLYALSTDITVLKENEIKLSALARHDALTGLPNRYQLNQKLIEAIARARRTGEHLAVLFLDVDHFKQINDRFGHAAGDAVLAEFARRMVTVVRATDTVARLAGDEFIVLLESLSAPQEPRLVAQKIIDRVTQPLTVAGNRIDISASIGIAFSEGLPMLPDELIARADKALYRAKAAGRGGFCDYREVDEQGGPAAI